ncbi:LysR family transcriptional regulator [Rhizorhabdus histidinilytica]|uniref:LysR substrate-binding domain-containing protein n=1 Tax=Rhizorhabdus histidinilytica TaxID=439228 RepID=UPI00321FB85A
MAIAAEIKRAKRLNSAVHIIGGRPRAKQGTDGCVTMAVERTHAIELRHLRYFVSAAEHGSFRKASADTGIQHSAISRRIRDLEHRLGTPLFLRHSGGVCLTFAGQRFLRRSRQILRNFGDGAQEIASITRSDFGRVKIGIYSSIASGYLAELLGLYADRHPKVQIDLIEDNPADQAAAIRRMQLDAAFLTGERSWGDCETLPLWSERVFAVLPGDHLLARHDELKWQHLADENFIVNEAGPGQEIHDYLVQRLATFGYHPQIRVHHIGRENLLPLVALNRGLTVVSEAMTAAHFPGIAYRPIIGEVLPFSAVWSAKNDNPALKQLLDLARSMSGLREKDAVTRPVSQIAVSAAPSQNHDRLQ